MASEYEKSQVVDVSDPTNSVLVGAAPFAEVREVAVEGRYTYVGSVDAPWVVDVEDPAHPRPMGSVAGFERRRSPGRPGSR